MTHDAIQQALTRRGFLTAAGVGALTLTQALSAARAAAAVLPLTPPPALSPDDPAVRATMAAYVDTIIPGPAGGADPAPGGIEAGALEEVYDPAYGASVVFGALHDDLLLTTTRILGRPGFDLSVPYRDRERVVVDRLKSTGRSGAEGDHAFILLYAGVAIIAYVAYYGTARSEVGPQYIGLPPRSDGYRHHSYRVRFHGMTADGNPH